MHERSLLARPAYAAIGWLVLSLALVVTACARRPHLMAPHTARWVTVKRQDYQALVRAFDEVRVVDEVGLSFKDPSTVQLRGVRARTDENVICGSFSIRNSFGRYAAFRDFVAVRNDRDRFTITPEPLAGDDAREAFIHMLFLRNSWWTYCER